MRKKIIKKYYFYFCLMLIAYILVLCAAYQLFVYYMSDVLLMGVTVVICLFIFKFVHSYIGVKNFISILIIEKDGDKFSSVLKPSKYFSPSAVYRALGSYYGGEHAETVNICEKAMKSEYGKNREYFFAEKLALTYFELGDDEKLRAAVNYFNAYTAASKKGEAIRKQFGAMRFLAAYLSGDIIACEKSLADSTEIDKRRYANLYEAQKNFFFAVACFRLGEKERAKSLFQSVISDAPKTHFARLAQKHLDAYATGDESVLVNREIVPDEGYEIFGKKMRSFLKLKKPILIFLTALIVVDLLILYLILGVI